MKRVHRALKLRHHKHTGKLLPHKHTSYRVLFSLMLAPIAMMALVGQLTAASDYVVSAKVPAPIPSGAPVITSPSDGATVTEDTVKVSGTCPVITPAIIIELYDNDSFKGSVVCGSDGSFSLPISLEYGSNKLVAKVITITGDYGNSSGAVTISHPRPSPSPSHVPSPGGQINRTPTMVDGLVLPLNIIGSDHFMVLGSDRHVVWRGKFVGGLPPYDVVVNWGDGITDKRRVADESEQSFEHTYKDRQSYNIIIRVTDALGRVWLISSGVASSFVPPAISFDGNLQANNGQNPFFAFIQKYLVQIYIATFFSVVFLWYLEHGRHLAMRQLHAVTGRTNRVRHH